MSKYTLHFKYQAVLHYLHIRSQQRTADHYGISRTHLRRWIRAYQEGGIGALEHPQSKTMPQHRKNPFIADSSPTNPTTKKHRQSLSKSCAICAQRLPT
ncbi:helix-turn-helix domain-containing protein [Neisseria subflava]|uniref:helix-turn-helix domain-containing protein n=1 Tax=Neisseria subflava TaxID=28449 RepID=UPI00202A3CF7|nr:helix-turn-helix domain-containing protein [Neisseria subflava]